MFIGVCVLCRISYSVSYLYVSFSGLITSAMDRLCYFIVAIPGPSIKLFLKALTDI